MSKDNEKNDKTVMFNLIGLAAVILAIGSCQRMIAETDGPLIHIEIDEPSEGERE